MIRRQIVNPPTYVYPDDDWSFIEARFYPRFLSRTETIFALSNGYFGIRGSFDEGRPVHAPGTFVNGFYESWPIVHAEEAYGFAKTGQTIVNVTDCRRSSGSTSTTSPCIWPTAEHPVVPSACSTCRTDGRPGGRVRDARGKVGAGLDPPRLFSSTGIWPRSATR